MSSETSVSDARGPGSSRHQLASRVPAAMDSSASVQLSVVLSAPATMLLVASGPGAAWLPNSYAMTVRSTMPSSLIAAAAVALVDQQRGPAELGPALPVAVRISTRVITQPTQDGDRHLVREEFRGGLPEELLVGGELPQHVAVTPVTHPYPTRRGQAHATGVSPNLRLDLYGVQYRTPC